MGSTVISMRLPAASGKRLRRMAVNYTEAFADEIAQALDEYRAVDFMALKRLLPQAVEFSV